MATPTIERPVQRPATDVGALFLGRYLSVTSFKRDGTGVATPVWFVSDGNRLFALTDLHSPKVRRIRRNPNVLIASCRADGKLRAKPVPARAEVLTARMVTLPRAGPRALAGLPGRDRLRSVD